MEQQEKKRVPYGLLILCSLMVASISTGYLLMRVNAEEIATSTRTYIVGEGQIRPPEILLGYGDLLGNTLEKQQEGEGAEEEESLDAPDQREKRDRGEIESSNGSKKVDEKGSVKQEENPSKGLGDVDLNQYVLNLLHTYDTSKLPYPYLLNNDYANYNGVTTNLYYKDRILLRAHPSGNRASHCVGITFEVFFKAMQERNRQLGLDPDDFNGMTWEQLYDFVLTWYVASGNKGTHNIRVAVEKYGIGKGITNFEEARPGDFLDFSRENNTGHTVVFLGWIREGGQIVGLRYWSSQESTRGISYNQEYFNVQRRDGTKYGNVMMDQVYIARILPVSQYRR